MENESPEEPLYSEPSLLSPASPKPIHIPTPTNIPVLNNMMDVGFNQTEVHMQDPSMRNTEVRDGAWKEPGNQEQSVHEESQKPSHASGDQAISTNDIPDTSVEGPAMTVDNDDTTVATTTASSEMPVQTEQIATVDAMYNGSTDPVTSVEKVAHASGTDALVTSNVDAALPSLDGQAQALPAMPSNVDVQSLLSFLQRPPQSVTPSANQNVSSVADIINAATLDRLPDAAPIQTHGSPNHDITYGTETAQQAVPGADLVHALSISTAEPTTSFAAPLTGSTPISATAAYAPTSRAPSSQRERKIAAGEPVTEDDAPWNAEIQQKYDDFIQEERKYVNAGNWDGFPYGSRLFVGNLSSDSVTKRDIFHVFHSYGPLAQISIKQAYGFVQFLHADDCSRALTTEQGRLVKDKRVHLEISKPQKSRNNNNNTNNNHNNNRNRSRSPVNRRRNERDSNRYRSPSPRGQFRDRYDDRRSRSPPSYGRSRYGRSPSPRDGDNLPLPKRAPQDVPDIQVIVRDNLDRDFIAWVEKAFLDRGVRIAVLILNPRLDEDAVIRRQILEGVLAVSRLDRQAQHTGKIGLRVFNRSRGVNNVSFDDYENLDPNICVELVLRARSQAAPQQAAYGYQAPQAYAQPAPPATQYGYGMSQPQYHAPPQQAYPQQYTTIPPQMQSSTGQAPQLDMGSLQNLLATARNGGPRGNVPQPAMPSGYPAGYPPSQQAQYAAAPTPQQPVYGGFQTNTPTYTTLPPQPPVRPPQQADQVNMQDILARLGNYSK